MRTDPASEEVVKAVDALTKRSGESHEDYLERAKANPIALRVKLADIDDNSDPSRLSKLPKAERERLSKKYLDARTVLLRNTGRIGGIMSGGQTGADQGAMDAAISYGIDYGGQVPKGRQCETGRIPEKYENLIELDSPDYLVRTKANVAESDCTLIFTYGKLEGGSKRTAEFAKRYKRPCLHIDLEALKREETVKKIAKWLREKCPVGCVLNCAGSRESKAPGIQRAVEVIMVDVLNAVNGFKVYTMHGDSDEAMKRK